MIRRPSFLSVFVKSPFTRIENHMSIVHDCVSILPDFYDAVQAEDWVRATELANKIRDTESQADLLKRKIQVKLHGDLYMPVPRSDILALLMVQDNMANLAEDLAGLMLNRKMVFPKEIQPAMRDLILHMVVTCNKAREVSAELKDLFEAGFEGVVLKLLKEAVDGLDALENTADKMQHKVKQAIFDIEKEYPPIDVYFWYQFVHELSSLVDWAQRVGTQLLILSSR